MLPNKRNILLFAMVFTLVMAMCAGVVLAGLSPPVYEELYRSPGFEMNQSEVSLVGWGYSGGGITTDDKHSGSYSYAIHVDGSNPVAALLVTNSGITETYAPGNTYLISFWAKTSAAEELVDLVALEDWNNTSPRKELKKINRTICPVWRKVSLSVTVPPSAVIGGDYPVYIQFYNEHRPNNTVYIDDLSIVKTNNPEFETQLYKYSDFEADHANIRFVGWGYSDSGVTSAEKYNGNYSYAIHLDGSNSLPAVLIENSEITETYIPGSSYIISFWAKTSGADEAVNLVALEDWNNNNPRKELGSASKTITNSRWNKVELLATVSNAAVIGGGYPLILTFFNPDNPNNTVYIDDFEIKKLPRFNITASTVENHDMNVSYKLNEFVMVTSSVVDESTLPEIKIHGGAAQITGAQASADGYLITITFSGVSENTDYILNLSGLKDTYGQRLNRTIAFSTATTYTVADITYSQTSLDAGSITAGTEVMNNSEDNVSMEVAFITAAFDLNGIIEDIDIDQKTVGPHSTGNFSATVTATERTNCVSSFVINWDNLSLYDYTRLKLTAGGIVRE